MYNFICRVTGDVTAVITNLSAADVDKPGNSAQVVLCQHRSHNQGNYLAGVDNKINIL